jgi:hypothetical protein
MGMSTQAASISFPTTESTIGQSWRCPKSTIGTAGSLKKHSGFSALRWAHEGIKISIGVGLFKIGDGSAPRCYAIGYHENTSGINIDGPYNLKWISVE